MTGAGRPGRPRADRDLVCQQLVELASDYVDGRLDPALRRRVEDHLQLCEHCSDYVAQIRRVLELTRPDGPRLPPALVSGLLAEFRRLSVPDR